MQQHVISVGKKYLKTFAKYRNCQKVRDNCHIINKHRGAAHSTCNLRFNVPKETTEFFT